MCDESDLVVERYARRSNLEIDWRYSMLNPAVWQEMQGRQRLLIDLLRKHSSSPLSELRLLEVGCGQGGNLLEFLRMGFKPEYLLGNELLCERVVSARDRLPSACQVLEGDATKLDFKEGSFDIVYQSTVFTSILDSQFQQVLADKMWSWVAPGGGVLWYDFTYNNPKNKDVRGVSLAQIKSLFPDAAVFSKKTTLAPPISRRVTQLHPSLYTLFNMLPFLRTHLLCWIEKPE
jgi:SAM-dependent methyltransferase